MTTGEKIRFHRRKQKITQKQLSEWTGIAEITIRQYEANKYVPRIENLKKMAHALNVSLAEFLDLSIPCETFHLSIEQRAILRCFESLNPKGRKEASKRMKELSQLPQYTAFCRPSTAG